MIPSRRTRLKVEKFVYEKGTNVALYHAEQSDRYKDFQSSLESALNEQIDYAVTDKNIETLIMLAKSVNPPAELLAQIATIIGKKNIGSLIAFAAYLQWAGEQGGQAAIDKLGIDAVFGLYSQEFIDYFTDYTVLLIKTVDDTTKKWLAETLQEGKSQGLSPYEIQKKIRDEGKVFSAIRAERIVLTETAKAMTTVEFAALKRNGIVDILWKTSLDERVCQICGPLHNVKGSVDKGFAGGYSGPPAHVSCRCYTEDVIPEGWEIPAEPWLGK